MSQLLKKYLERRYIDRNDKAISSVFPGIGTFLRTYKVWKRLQNKAHHKRHDGIIEEFEVAPYSLNNPVALRIRSFLKEFKHPAIAGAIVQGSIATGEENDFSDFDAILLIDISAIQTKRHLSDLYKIVHESAHLMKRQDPLQHHGWSILFKQELKRYPDAELPSILLQKGKMLYPESAMKFSIMIDKNHQDYRTLYENLCTGIYRRLDHPSTFNSYYRTKLLISECLLLPAAFIQAKQNKPVWKADSFEQINSFLPANQLKVFEEISKIRTNWANYFNGKKKKEPVHPDLISLFRNSLNQKIKDLIAELDSLLDVHEKR